MNAIQSIRGIDIYLLDQIMKDRYSPTQKILDAGCGKGRNMHWFIHNGFDIKGIDPNIKAIESLWEKYPRLKDKFKISTIENCPFENESFNHIICNAVLHFARSTNHFHEMFDRLIALCKTDGQIFIRMTSDIGIENKVKEIKDGVYQIPDGSTRFLLTLDMVKMIKSRYPVDFIEPLKTVNVDGVRCMSTLVLRKKVIKSKVHNTK